MAPFLFLITWWVAWLTPKPQRFAYKLAYYLIATIMLIITFAKTIDAYDEYWHPQVLLQQESNVYVGPATSYGISRTLAPGTNVRLYEKQTGWCKIKRQHLVGWVPAEKIEIHKDVYKG